LEAGLKETMPQRLNVDSPYFSDGLKTFARQRFRLSPQARQKEGIVRFLPA